MKKFLVGLGKIAASLAVLAGAAALLFAGFMMSIVVFGFVGGCVYVALYAAALIWAWVKL